MRSLTTQATLTSKRVTLQTKAVNVTKYIWLHYLTPLRKALFEILVIPQTVEDFLAFYETRKVIVFKMAHHLSLPPAILIHCKPPILFL
jgi:hypothetical protein